MSINVYIVRHGQTILNLYNRMQGWADAPLTESGRNDGITAGKALASVHFDYAFASDLPRAMQTAELVLAQLPEGSRPTLQVNKNFREQSMGYLEGENGGRAASIIAGKHYDSFADLAKDMPLSQIRDLMAKQDPNNIAENNEDFLKRINTGVDQLGQLPDNSNILLVSHGLVIHSLMDKYAKGTNGHTPENGSIQLLEIKDGQPAIKFYNRFSLPQDN